MCSRRRPAAEDEQSEQALLAAKRADDPVRDAAFGQERGEPMLLPSPGEEQWTLGLACGVAREQPPQPPELAE
jgi:hypothetical protein